MNAKKYRNGAVGLIYDEEMFLGVAKRENNNKRNFLVVNKWQGKHMPVPPKRALGMFLDLAEKIKENHSDEKLVLIGFAETATAIGAAIACSLGCDYIQTTREVLDEVSEYLFFSEEHSHATEQKLVKCDIDAAMEQADRIVFIEDEVTTGKTILNIITLLQKTYGGRVSYCVASILNLMHEEAILEYERRDISLYWLLKGEHKMFSNRADSFAGDGKYEDFSYRLPEGKYSETVIFGCENARRLTTGEGYTSACELLINRILENLHISEGKRILVLGTEEFMYPALYFGNALEDMGLEVHFHATTRSPIVVSREADYPLHSRCRIKSPYEDARTTYIYNLDKYDYVFIVTDAVGDAASLLAAVEAAGNREIYLIRWR